MSHLTRVKTAGLIAASGQRRPPVSVHKIAADLGASIERAALPSHLPGFAALVHSQWCIWINTAHKSRRHRWVIAHELGHLVLDHHGVAFLDSGERTLDQLSANRFAAELLMPETMVYREHENALEHGLSVGDLADIFLVDKRVAELRLQELALEL